MDEAPSPTPAPSPAPPVRQHHVVQTNAPLLIEDKLLEIAGDIEDVIEKFDAAFGAEPMRVLREKLPERTGLLPAEIDSIADQLQAPRHALTSDA